MNDAMKIMQKRRRAQLVKEEYFSLVEDGYLTQEIASTRLGISVEEFEQMMKEWQKQKGEENGTGCLCGPSERD